MAMQRKTDSILKVLNVLSWIAFIGLCIEAGALLFNFIYSLFNPSPAQKLYKTLDLSALQVEDFTRYIAVMSFIVVLAILKALLFYSVVRLFMKLNIVNPFTPAIARLIEKISYESIGIAVVSFIAHQYFRQLLHKGYEIKNAENYWSDWVAFLMMAAVVYVISQIFQKGIALQKENDLTV